MRQSNTLRLWRILFYFMHGIQSLRRFGAITSTPIIIAYNSSHDASVDVLWWQSPKQRETQTYTYAETGQRVSTN